MQKSFKVTIDSVQYSLVSDEQESYVVQAAHTLTNLLQSVYKAGVVEREKAAVLVALQLATQILKSQEYERHLDEKTKNLIKKLETDPTIAELF